MRVLGIDIGLTGAIASVSHTGSVDIHDIPTLADGDSKRIDGGNLIRLLRVLAPPGEPAIVVFENVRPRSIGNGGRATNSMHSQGSLMRSRGILECALDIARFRSEAVEPQTWKRLFGLIGKPKEQALDVARGLYPAAQPSLARKKDINRADALLIAHWGLRTLS